MDRQAQASLSRLVWRWLPFAAVLAVLGACKGGGGGGGGAPPVAAGPERPSEQQLYQAQPQVYEHKETRDLVALVNEAASMIQAKGEQAFAEFRVPGSRWRQQDTYVFVLDPRGEMLVHADSTMEGKNQLELQDVNGKKIVRGLLAAAMASPGKSDGWYHYEWPVPGSMLARWKSSYVRRVAAPSGKTYVVGSGMYNDRMERAFVVDMVQDAASQIEKSGTAAFPLLRDPKERFIAKDAYIFVYDANGKDLVNPAFPNLEGRSLLDMQDTKGKKLIREMLEVAKTRGSGWVDYMWPKPGESASTQKSAFVKRAKLGDQWVLVGAGVYLADAPKAARDLEKMTAPQLIGFVRQAAAVFEKQGEKAYPEFRQQGSKWFHGDTYFFAMTMDGTRTLHAANPSLEGQSVTDAKDVLGRPYGKMMLEAASTPSGEGWVHYMYPEPGSLFPAWKSAFMKRVTFPSGKQHVIGSAVYGMQMDKSLIVDVVDRAASLVAKRGTAAFDELRDKKGPFVFMDTYVFVARPDGVEVVNPGQPSMEGKNIIDVKDVNGKAFVREYYDRATRDGSTWVDYYWYKPGDNTPARKQTYVRRVQAGKDAFFVGAGIYTEQ